MKIQSIYFRMCHAVTIPNKEKLKKDQNEVFVYFHSR